MVNLVIVLVKQTRKKLETFASSFFFQKMVGTVGLEPTRDFSQRILSPLRLPIPPRPHHLWRFRSDLN